MTGANKLFSARRKLLCDQMLDDSIAIVGSSHHFSRNSDSLFPFRQDSNFLYLSGFAEAESVLVIRSLGKKKEFIMFCRDRDPLREQWDGFRAGPKGALSNFGADEAYSISELDKVMPSLFKGVNNIYYSMHKLFFINQDEKDYSLEERSINQYLIELPAIKCIIAENKIFRKYNNIKI